MRNSINQLKKTDIKNKAASILSILCLLLLAFPVISISKDHNLLASTHQTNKHPFSEEPNYLMTTKLAANFLVKQSPQLKTSAGSLFNFLIGEGNEGISYLSGLGLASTGSELSQPSYFTATSGGLQLLPDKPAKEKTGGQITSFQLTASVSGKLPFTIGLGFKKGDVPSTPSLDIPDQQIIVKRRWNDGSVKHAIASGHIALSEKNPKLINVLRSSTSSSPIGKSLTATDIQRVNPQASVQFSGYETVNLSNLLAHPVRTWISGPEMVESHYHSAVANDPTLNVWFFVRLYKNGRIWIRTIVENGNMDDSRRSKSYVPTVIVGGAKIYDNGGNILTHYDHTRWCVEAWIGVDPQITPKHDTTYLIETKLVPNYWKRNPSEKAFKSLIQEYSPMDRGNLTDSMGRAGYQPQIGLLTKWDALYASSGDARAFRAALANASSLNSYPIVWRDAKTQFIVKPSDHPNFGLKTYQYRAGNNIWEMNHAPSEGYLAYLITGDYWYYETTLMHSSLVYLALNGGLTGLGVNRILVAETRGTAWNLRTLSQLVGIAPESDAVAADYQKLLANNMKHWKSVKDRLGGAGIGYLYERNVNLYDHGTIAPWMQHFFMQSLGMGSDLEPLPDMTIYNEVRDWLYRGVVGILGDSSGFCFNYGGSYKIKITDEGSKDPTTWFRDWRSVYVASFNNPACGNWLEGKGSQSAENASTGYWGNLLPAIAYAVDHGAPGALAAWSRLINAGNWSVLENSGFDVSPNWGIVPRAKKNDSRATDKLDNKRMSKLRTTCLKWRP